MGCNLYTYSLYFCLGRERERTSKSKSELKLSGKDAIHLIFSEELLHVSDGN